MCSVCGWILILLMTACYLDAATWLKYFYLLTWWYTDSSRSWHLCFLEMHGVASGIWFRYQAWTLLSSCSNSSVFRKPLLPFPPRPSQIRKKRKRYTISFWMWNLNIASDAAEWLGPWMGSWFCSPEMRWGKLSAMFLYAYCICSLFMLIASFLKSSQLMRK